MTKNRRSAFVSTDLIEICQVLVGLKDVNILEYCRFGLIPTLMIESVVSDMNCPNCHWPARIKERPKATYVDLSCFGTPMRLVWKKHRFVCPRSKCRVKTWTHKDPRIAAKGSMMTNRAARFVVKQVGIFGRTVTDVAKDLHCGWDAVNNAVLIYGKALLDADHKRLKETHSIGLDETLAIKTGKFRQKHWATTVVDVENHQLIDILPTRDFKEVAAWIDSQPLSWKQRIQSGALDMSNTYAAVYSVTLPNIDQVVDPFHLIKLANKYLDQIRRRVQREEFGDLKRKDNPIYKSRKLLIMGQEKLDEQAKERLKSLLALGDPNAEIAIAHRIKEALRDFYSLTDSSKAEQFLEEIRAHCAKQSMPPELQSLARTIKHWFQKILNWHKRRISNGPTEGINNLIKRIKRIGFGFRNFENYRIRALLYAGKPNWNVLDSIVVQ